MTNKKGIKLRIQLLIAFIILIFITVIFTTVTLSIRSYLFMKDNEISKLTKVNQQVTTNFELLIEQIDNNYNFLISNRFMFDNLLNEDFGVGTETFEGVIYFKELLYALINNTTGLNSAYYITKQGTEISSFSGSAQPDFLSNINFNQLPIVKTLYTNPENEIWYTDDLENSNFIYYMRSLRNPLSGGVLGVIVFVLDIQIVDIQVNNLKNENFNFYICDKNVKSFSKTNTNSVLNNNIKDMILNNPNKSFFENKKHYLIANRVSNDWVVVTEILKSDLYNINEIVIMGSITSFIFILLGGLFSFYFSKKITKDFSSIINAMKKSRSGIFQTISTSGISFESKLLLSNYNSMIQDIEALTDSLKIEIKEKVKAEIEIKSLVKFIDENPAPIVRLTSDMILDYSNINADYSFLDSLFYNDKPKVSWFNEKSVIEGFNKVFEVKFKEVIYAVKVINISGKEGFFLYFQDITSEREYAYLYSLWDNMFENSVEGITITDINGNIERVNKSFTNITGYKPEEVLGKSTNILKSDRHLTAFYSEMWTSLKDTGNWSGEIWNRRKSGEAYPEWLGISSFVDGSTGLTKYFAVFHDISDKKLQEEKMEWISTYDALTGFTNRPFFLEKLHSEFAATDKNSEICAVMMMNIDGFKNVNNSYGFQFGDSILEEFSKRLNSSIKTEYVISRFGGDEFAVLTPRLKNKNELYPIIRNIQEAINVPFIIDGNSINISVSLGASIYPNDGISSVEILTKASSALVRTKQNRKGSYSIYNSELDNTFINNSNLEIPLKKAIENEELEVFYQPKVHSKENRIYGFEALIRWKMNGQQFISPEVFIPIAEDNGYIIEIGNFVIKKACEFVLSLRKTSLTTINVGINVSARQLAEDDFIDNLCSILKSVGVKPSEIDIEITERIAASNVYNAIDSLTRLSNYGFSISIDDFGTGYSSLKYLLELPFDTMKIDKSFVDTILDKEGKDTVLKTMINLAHSLNKKIVAEGVEIKEQVDYLSSNNCYVIQGYFYSKPLPELEIIKLLETDKLI